MARELSPQSPGRRVFVFLGLLYCFIVLWCIYLVPGHTQCISHAYDTI